jgi:hypothetical protein
VETKTGLLFLRFREKVFDEKTNKCVSKTYRKAHNKRKKASTPHVRMFHQIRRLNLYINPHALTRNTSDYMGVMDKQPFSKKILPTYTLAGSISQPIAPISSVACGDDTSKPRRQQGQKHRLFKVF